METQIKERPILFNGAMVRAILDGRKTQTRRVVKPVGNDDGFVMLDHGNGFWPYRSDDGESSFHTVSRGGKLYHDETPHSCPYGKVGDRLWVREAWGQHDDGESPWSNGVWYRACEPDACSKWTPSIHMPRWASRILLEITGVRVERLNDISHEDAMAEGMALDDSIYDYSRLWESINGAGSWAENPWAWVVEFKRCEA